ncbi:hypothetical protein, partial [Desulfovibrio sp.]|uniref:hypothetical protein n=1 Tax=Desulfovibrio sp. TaxID=885 RepID=UPI00261F09EA
KIWPLWLSANCADLTVAHRGGAPGSGRNCLQYGRYPFIACIGLPLIKIVLSTPLGGMHEGYS